MIPAYNEEEIIAEKLENTLAAEYPRDRLDVIVASDGSDDRTNERVRNFGDGVRLLDLPRAGKNAALNEAAAAARGEIIAFTDADVKLTENAFRRLVAPSRIDRRRRRRRAAARRPLEAAAPEHRKRTMRRLLSPRGASRPRRASSTRSGKNSSARFPLASSTTSGSPPASWRVTGVSSTSPRRVRTPSPVPPCSPTPSGARSNDRPVVSGRLARPRPAQPGRARLLCGSARIAQATPAAVFRSDPRARGERPLLRRSGPFYRAAWLAQTGLHGAALAGYLLRGTRLGRFKVLKAALTFDLNQAAAAVAVVGSSAGRTHGTDVGTTAHGGAGPSQPRVCGDVRTAGRSVVLKQSLHAAASPR